jgi:hypothetical protein
MWCVSRRIHQASLQRDKEMTELYLNIMAAIMVSSNLVGESTLSIRLLEDQKKELLKLFEKPNPKQFFSFFSFFKRFFLFKRRS